MKKGQWAIGSTRRAGLLCNNGESFIISDDFEDGGQFEGKVMLFDEKIEAQAAIADMHGSDVLMPIEFDYYLHF